MQCRLENESETRRATTLKLVRRNQHVPFNPNELTPKGSHITFYMPDLKSFGTAEIELMKMELILHTLKLFFIEKDGVFISIKNDLDLLGLKLCSDPIQISSSLRSESPSVSFWNFLNQLHRLEGLECLSGH
jgi:hypothetical protein